MSKIPEEVWREFEKLIFEIIRDTLQLNEENSISEITEKRNDGGYDGLLYQSTETYIVDTKYCLKQN